ncbi:hypothetical protein O3Q52_10675 [Streptomyces sp. ActVer]|uniref:hypothetical protein n=1 Tax=Streptomyces sp. ActVer TaxID=3014558 RepID=UPI0022B30561|nr:hypothetical protein [Streptomyces sp. ActVer]MCZ4508662.1 hypothetical protein [Streptomyces sp. ActVer]
MNRRAGRLHLAHPAERRRPAPTYDRWARRIAARYGLSLPEARAELRRLAARGWMTWEFHARFDDDRKDLEHSA